MSDLTHLFENYRKYGFDYRVIDGRHLIGMRGNLDCIHDALIVVSEHDSDGREARDVAKFIVKALNDKLETHVRETH